MKKNPFSTLINHKVLHKIGKQWVAISIGLIMFLSGATMLSHQPVHASKVANQQPVAVKVQPQRPTASHIKKQNSVVNSTQPKQIQRNAQALHQKLMKNAVRTNLHATQTKVNPKQKTALVISKPKINRSQRVITLARHAHKRAYRHYRHYRKGHKHYRRSHSNYHNYGHLWLNSNHQATVDGIPYGKLGYFTSAHGDEYPNYFDEVDTNPAYVKIVDKDRVNGYNFYRSRSTYGRKTYWFLATDYSNHKYRKVNNKRFQKFLTKTDHRFLRKHFNYKDRKQVLRVRNRFIYLLHHENQTYSSHHMSSFRHHIIDWINFYRCYLYNENPVYENSSFNATAQQGADTQSDPEDMNWGDDNPYTIVRSYITDAADADHDGKTGHRDSVLNPQAGNVGVGQHSDVNALYFDFGNTHYYNDNQDIDYPRIISFPIDLAVDGEYWSMQSDALGDSNHDTVEAYDITNPHHHRRLGAYGCTLINNSTYFKVPTRKLHTGHTYKVVLNCDDYETPYWYTFTLYDLDPYTGDIMSV